MAAKTDWRSAEETFTSRERALCAFAEKLTREPAAMGPEDLDALREEGLDDGEITEAVHVIGFFNHINRVADALGVDLESWMEDGAEGDADAPTP